VLVGDPRRLQATLLALVALVGNACGGSANVVQPHASGSQSYVRRLNLRLFGKIHAAHQVLEARVRTEIVKTGINFQQHHPVGPLLVCGFQPLECLVRLTKGCVDPGPPVRCYIPLL
jgi:hypothetical protein